MAQADGVVANGTGSAVRSDINNQYAALWSNHSGSTEPSSGKVAYQFWADTNTSILKIRNSANNAWINLFTLAGGIDVDAASNFNEDVTFTGASYNLVWDKSDNALEFADNAKCTFGAADLSLYHDGTHSYIDNSTNALKIRGDLIRLNDKTNDHQMLKAVVDNTVELFFDNDKKFETLTNGCQIKGQTRFAESGGTFAAFTDVLQSGTISDGGTFTAQTHNCHAGGLVTITTNRRPSGANNKTIKVIPIVINSTSNATLGTALSSIDGTSDSSFTVAGTSQGVIVTNTSGADQRVTVRFDITGA